MEPGFLNFDENDVSPIRGLMERPADRNGIDDRMDYIGQMERFPGRLSFKAGENPLFMKSVEVTLGEEPVRTAIRTNDGRCGRMASIAAGLRSWFPNKGEDDYVDPS